MFARRDGEAANLAQRVAYGWQTLPAPVIAAVHGNCIGGGAQIALGADLRIIAPGSQVSIREVYWGLIPDMGHDPIAAPARPLRRRQGARPDGTDPRRRGGGPDRPRDAARRRSAAPPPGRWQPRSPRARPTRPGAARTCSSAPGTCRRPNRWRSRRSCSAELLGSPNQVKAVGAGMSGEPADYDDPG